MKNNDIYFLANEVLELLHNFMNGMSITYVKNIEQKITICENSLYRGNSTYIDDLKSKLSDFNALRLFLEKYSERKIVVDGMFETKSLTGNDYSVLKLLLTDISVNDVVELAYDDYDYYYTIYSAISKLEYDVERNIAEFNDSIRSLSDNCARLNAYISTYENSITSKNYNALLSKVSRLEYIKTMYERIALPFNELLVANSSRYIVLKTVIDDLSMSFDNLLASNEVAGLEYYKNELTNLYYRYNNEKSRLLDLDGFYYGSHKKYSDAELVDFNKSMQAIINEVKKFNSSDDSLNELISEINEATTTGIEMTFGDFELIKKIRKFALDYKKSLEFDKLGTQYNHLLSIMIKDLRVIEKDLIFYGYDKNKLLSIHPFNESSLIKDFIEFAYIIKEENDSYYVKLSNEGRIISFNNMYDSNFFIILEDYLISNNTNINSLMNGKTLEAYRDGMPKEIYDGLVHIKSFNEWMVSNNLDKNTIIDSTDFHNDKHCNYFASVYDRVNTIYSNLSIKTVVSEVSKDQFVKNKYTLLGLIDEIRNIPKTSNIDNEIFNMKRMLLNGLYDAFDGDVNAIIKYFADKVFEINSLFKIDDDFKKKIINYYSSVNKMDELITQDKRNMLKSDYIASRKLMFESLKSFSSLEMIAIDPDDNISSLYQQEILDEVVMIHSFVSRLPFKSANNFIEAVKKIKLFESFEVDGKKVSAFSILIHFLQDNNIIDKNGSLNSSPLFKMTKFNERDVFYYGNSVMNGKEASMGLTNIANSYYYKTGNVLYTTKVTRGLLIRLINTNNLLAIKNNANKSIDIVEGLSRKIIKEEE